MATISDEEMVKTISEFIEMGHVENIVSMFKQDTDNYRYVGKLIQDERFMVRMGMVLLFEELKEVRPEEISQAIPYLAELLTEKTPVYVLGEVLTILGIIGNSEAKRYLAQYVHHENSQLSEIAKDYAGAC